MKTMSKVLALVLVLMMMLTAAAPAFAASAVKISHKKLTMTAGFTEVLKVTGAKGKAKWSSSNPEVAKVSSKGKVTALKAGSAVISAKVKGKELKCKVTVKANTMKTTSKPSNVRLTGNGISFFPQKLSFDKKKNLVVKGFFTNSSSQFVYRLSNYRISIYADGQLLADMYIGRNVSIPSHGYYYDTLTFPRAYTSFRDIRNSKTINVKEFGFYN